MGLLNSLKDIKTKKRPHPGLATQKQVLPKIEIKKIDWDSFEEPESFLDFFENENEFEKSEKSRILLILKKDFVKAYEKYRIAADIENGKRPFVVISNRSEKMLHRAAKLCAENKVTPYRLFKFWHSNKRNFISSVSYLPINFICSEFAILTVAGFEDEIKFGNSFDTLKRIDTNIRSVLKKNGFNGDGIDDSSLLQLQYAAMAISSGIRIATFGKNKAKIRCLVDYYKTKEKNEKRSRNR